ncbi:MAG: radical SAM protein [Candidatus Omnitrophica bacterium]|nr:radical SAM protein [Candidatus Omnitrophota bacterium]
MRYIYGPVRSRRIGFSLGVSLTPRKVCNFNCVYCQLGETAGFSLERKEYIPIGDILDELKLWLVNNAQEAKDLNYITISGSGEPTLNSGIGLLISRIKQMTDIPVAVITNASLLKDASLRQELRESDLIVPSLDAATEPVFRKIDRPAPDIKLEDIIEGLVTLRKDFRGKVWLEVMLAAGINDGLPHIRKLKELIQRINPDKIQLNSPVRTTAEPGVSPVGKKKLEKIKEILGEKCEII